MTLVLAGLLDSIFPWGACCAMIIRSRASKSDICWGQEGTIQCYVQKITKAWIRSASKLLQYPSHNLPMAQSASSLADEPGIEFKSNSQMNDVVSLQSRQWHRRREDEKANKKHYSDLPKYFNFQVACIPAMVTLCWWLSKDSERIPRIYLWRP